MGVDQTSLDRIRNATFPSSRRGYDKHEVEKFLARLADWLETGAGDESRSDTVKRELERVGQRTGAILAQAEESAQQIRAEAEEEARETITNASAQAEQARAEADAYSTETRGSADAYSEQARKAAEQEAQATRDAAEADARKAIESGQAQARRIIDEGTQRREDVESVIADLVRRRDEVLDDTEQLAAKLTNAVGEHQPAGADPFERPDQLDPLAREAEEGGVGDAEAAATEVADAEVEDAEMEGGTEEAETPEDLEAEAEGSDQAAEKPKQAKSKSRPRRGGKRGKVKA